MIIVPMEPWHLERLELQPHQAALAPTIAQSGYRQDLAKLESYAGLDGDEVLGCMGILPQWHGRAIAWGLLGNVGPHRFMFVHRAILRWLEHAPRRVETWIDVGHEAGERWAKSLGFVKEGLMEAFHPKGTDAWLYARIRR